MLPFLKYKEGARLGYSKTPKRNLESESSDPNPKKRSYEDKRERKFMPHWTEGRPWLTFDTEKKKMFCTWCVQNKVSDCKFVSGTENLKLFAVKQHEASKYHKHFAPKYIATSTVSGQISDAHMCLEMLQKADYDRLVIKFRTAHAVAKHFVTIVSYVDLMLQKD